MSNLHHRSAPVATPTTPAAASSAPAATPEPPARPVFARRLPKPLALRLIDPATDPWHAAAEAEGPAREATPAPHLCLALPQWQALRARWPADTPVGVRLANDADPALLADDLDRLTLVELHFPKWTDGRAYSQAHLLRRRWVYRGELRATGEVLVDMLPLLVRTGFDAAVLRDDQSHEAAQRALGFFDGFYQ